MRSIFVSYRRDDSEGEAGRLFDDLAEQFGEASVFMDVTAIQAGRDYRKAIDESVATCGVLLAVIGKNWVNATNEAGDRRLDDPFDFVRLETASALKRDIPVIPVLVHGASMPRPDQLPDALKDLAYRNGCELTHARWTSDVQLLIKALRGYVEAPSGPARRSPPAIAGGAAAQPATAPNPARVGQAPAQNRGALRRFVWKSRGVIFGMVALAVVIIGIAADKLFTPAPKRKTEAAIATTVQVPQLNGMSLNSAKQALRDRRLAVGSISKEPRSDVEQDTVLDEFPKYGRTVDSGTPIDLVISDSLARPNPPSHTATKNHSHLPTIPIVEPQAAQIVSSGTALLKGTFTFDLDTGQEGAFAKADIWWEQKKDGARQMTATNGARLVNLGITNFSAITANSLESLPYATTPIGGNDDATNQLRPGNVFAVRTSENNLAKVLILSYGYNLRIQWVTYKPGASR